MATTPILESGNVTIHSEIIDNLSDVSSLPLSSDAEVNPAANVTDINSSIFAHKWKEIISLHKNLTELGASDFSQHHARITVIGGQSGARLP
ncbi:hypothetical protein FISHEDRAFT_73187 [Fistulina hepatica ATCC 64428]|uniref:Uncharacterized protein n=1 Tax=Fistulina hepatica ATCC 64428 TaxID=1128425 RepID=A0A0D7AD37_9AGAR|nr:hypothetical protein FISHEDRAFT_73187 [Fistulina hepatica ATCC 64428]